METTQGTLFIFSAPSGAGKTSLIKSLLEHTHDLTLSTSYTTRPQREGETNGIDYHFIDSKHFQTMIDQGDFFEHARVFNHFYGTGKQFTQKQLLQGKDLILEIDWQGAQQVRQYCPQAVSIFILPPDWPTLSQRLHHRGQDKEQVIQHRLSAAKEEMSHMNEYDYLIINDQFDEALDQIKSIIHAERLRYAKQAMQHAQLLQDLLA